MTIHVIPGKGYDSNIYIIDGKQPSIIDTGTGLNAKHIEKEIRKRINPTSITQIIFTHEHFDHTGGAQHVLGLTENTAHLIAHSYTKEKIDNKESMFAAMLGGSMPDVTIDTIFNGGEQIIIGDHQYEVIFTPGHSPGCLCFYCKEEKILFSGDTVFSHGSFGRTDFPGGSLRKLQESIHYLSTLDITDLYPGHESCVIGNASKHIALSYQNIFTLG